MSQVDSRALLMAATITIIGRDGIGALTVRRVAAEAGVNQALVSYHFGGVAALLREAYVHATTALVSRYAERFADVTTFAQFHDVGVQLANDAKHDGSAAVLAQALAASYHDPQQAEVFAELLQDWRSVVEATVRRLLGAHNLDNVVEVEAMTSALTAACVGMTIVDALEPAPLGTTMPMLTPIVRLADMLLKVTPAPVLRRFLRR